jgi:outer membrane immunogenic protein
MRKIFLATAAMLACGASAASAMDWNSSFRGFRLEGNLGLDHFQSQGTNSDKFGYGGTFGFDGQLGDRIVIGPEVSYWRPGNGNENCTDGVNGGSVCHKGFEQWGAAVRAGYLVTPSTLVFAKGGYASQEQRKRFDPAAGSGETGYYNHGRTNGYQVGGGVEYSFDKLQTPLPVYVNAQYVYSNFSDHTSTQRAMMGIGVRFKP